MEKKQQPTLFMSPFSDLVTIQKNTQLLCVVYIDQFVLICAYMHILLLTI